MAKIGPRHLVVSAERLGRYGATSWHVELKCGHTLSTPRKPKIGITRMSCKKCAVPSRRSGITEFVDFSGTVDADSTLADLRAKAALAAHFGVAMDNVDLLAGTATVFVDAQHVRFILGH